MARAAGALAVGRGGYARARDRSSARPLGGASLPPARNASAGSTTQRSRGVVRPPCSGPDGCRRSGVLLCVLVARSRRSSRSATASQCASLDGGPVPSVRWSRSASTTLAASSASIQAPAPSSIRPNCLSAPVRRRSASAAARSVSDLGTNPSPPYVTSFARPSRRSSLQDACRPPLPTPAPRGASTGRAGAGAESSRADYDR
jgi:hypothetical protein